MRLTLEAEPQELRDKGEALTQALAKHLAPHNPELAECLCKAVPPKRVESDFLGMRQLQNRMRVGYEAEMDRALSRIYQLLDDAKGP